MRRRTLLLGGYLGAIHVALAGVLLTSNFVPAVDKKLGISESLREFGSPSDANARRLAYTGGDQRHTLAWQDATRNRLFELMGRPGPVAGRAASFEPELLFAETRLPDTSTDAGSSSRGTHFKNAGSPWRTTIES